MAEGIIFGGYLLSEEEFIPLFIEWYEQKGQLFKMELESLKEELNAMYERRLRDSASNPGKKKLGVYRTEAYDASLIYKKWENIQKNYFGNDSVTLIAITRFEGKELTWTKNINENEFITQSGINITAAQFNKMVKTMNDTAETVFAAEIVQQFLRNHYAQMCTQLTKYRINEEEAQMLRESLNKKSALYKSRFEQFTGKTYGDIIFASQTNAEGKQLDAFMNHIGQYNKQLFYIMTKGNASKNELNSITKFDTHNEFLDIFTKPKVVQPWLVASLNSTSWLTGGDVVVIDDSGAVIYNIQIKSTSEGKNFELALLRLSSLINRMINQMSKEKVNPRTLAKIIFNALKTSSSNEINRTENFIETETYEMIKRNLNLN